MLSEMVFPDNLDHGAVSNAHDENWERKWTSLEQQLMASKAREKQQDLAKLQLDQIIEPKKKELV